jgi:regulator of protease activity HflC (stomatin/prohibitin superfamily)
MNTHPAGQPKCGLFLCVHEKEVAIITRFGKFERYETPGFSLVPICVGMSVAGTLSMRVRQLDVTIETKTRDNVFVTMVVSVQYQVQETKAFTAFFKLSDPRSQITAFVCDVVRSTVPKLPLDEVFATKEEIARAVQSELCKTMDSFGYTIKQALVTDIEPDRYNTIIII